MTPSAEPPAPERPFPGARSPVPGARSLSVTSRDPAVAGVRTLAVQATCTRADAGGGWIVRLPVRAEQVTVTKEVAVFERVIVRRRRVDETAHVDATVHREELRTTTHGEVDVTETR